MIKRLVDFALNNRFIILVAALLLFGWGAISFHNLPVEAYPDVANNYVNVITQWPGRSAEDVEQQVTVPLENGMAGIPHMTHLRSTTLAGLSSVTMIFDDDSIDDVNREKVLERLGQVTLPTGLQPQIGTDWSPVGQIYWYTLKSTNPSIDTMQLKSIEDWQLEKAFRSVPGVVDVSSFGGITREYQVIVDPDKLIAYGLTIQQVQQQIAANNVNAGGSFIEQGDQQINVQEVGLFTNVHDIEQVVLKTSNGTPIRVSDVARVVQGPKIRLGQIGKTCKPEDGTCGRGDKAIHRDDGKLVDDSDVVEGVVLLQKGDNSDSTLDAIHAKVKDLNEHILPPGVKIVPFLDRSDLLALTTHTVLHNLTEGILLVALILFLFLGNLRGALIVAITIPFSLLFASICLDLRHIPANLLSLGALDFGMVVEGAVVMVENIVRHLSHERRTDISVMAQIRDAAHEVQRPVFYAITIIITAYLPIFTLQSVEGRLFKPMAWTVAFALLGSLIFSMILAPVLASFLFPNGTTEWENPVMVWLTQPLPSQHHLGHRPQDRSVLHGHRHAPPRRLPHVQRRHRLRVPSPPRRRRHLGSRLPRPQHRPHRKPRHRQQNPHHPGQLPRGHPGRQPDRPPRRRHRHHRLLQHRILRRPQTQRPMASRLPRRQGRAHRRHGSRARKNSRRRLELLPTHLRQRRRSRQRRQRRARRQALRHRPQRPSKKRATRSSTS